MNHLPHFMKWFCRIALVMLLGSFTYVVTRPSYNFAHWLPHNPLRRLGVDYQSLLWFEQNADLFLHSIGAFIITLLLTHAQIPKLSRPAFRAFLFVFSLTFAAEGVQYLIGRGIETSDLALGILGSFVAYLLVNKNK